MIRPPPRGGSRDRERMRWLVLSVLLPTVAAADPVVPAAPEHRSCSTRAYLEPSLLGLYESGHASAFTRVAAGVLVRTCDSPIQVRVGGTTYVGHVGQLGIGIEAEVNDAITDDLRLGLHVAYETAHEGALESADLRLHVRDGAWLQVGAFAWSRFDGVDSGVAAGIGIEDWQGAVAGAVELGAGGLFFLYVLYSLPRA